MESRPHRNADSINAEFLYRQRNIVFVPKIVQPYQRIRSLLPFKFSNLLCKKTRRTEDRPWTSGFGIKSIFRLVWLQKAQKAIVLDWWAYQTSLALLAETLTYVIYANPKVTAIAGAIMHGQRTYWRMAYDGTIFARRAVDGEQCWATKKWRLAAAKLRQFVATQAPSNTATDVAWKFLRSGLYRCACQMAAAATLFNHYANIIGLGKKFVRVMRSSARLLWCDTWFLMDYTIMFEGAWTRWMRLSHKRWAAVLGLHYEGP